MALAWHPIGLALVDTVINLARSPWNREALDQTWQQTGWPPPEGGSLAKQILDDEEWPMVPAGEWNVGVIINGESTRVRGFSVGFALFYEPDDIWDPDPDPDLIDFPQHIPSDIWRIDRTADRTRFRGVWEEGHRTVAQRLGAPNVIDDGWNDDSEWQHAVWRLGARLVIVAQGDDITTYSLYDEASLQVIDYPDDRPIPTGWDLHGLLLGSNLE
ncbi:hypothetical protein EDD27_8262 [Nonomuraea polychroma]|uniref:Uncharacterized protein n=1 Tax=Nonomuraea polychroma TaxID=46176 RepID=A0A438MJ82_9ACTN|nr:hypothetical protein [Nonomuraea polychroma]RVX45461.1 hypothetical protein EDD27_8262 [Nonomuraea polychroma]